MCIARERKSSKAHLKAPLSHLDGMLYFCSFILPQAFWFRVSSTLQDEERRKQKQFTKKETQEEGEKF